MDNIKYDSAKNVVVRPRSACSSKKVLDGKIRTLLVVVVFSS